MARAAALSFRRSRARFALHTFSRIQNVAGHKQCSGLIGRINQVLSLVAILISKAQLGRLEGLGSRREDCGICDGRGKGGGAGEAAFAHERDAILGRVPAGPPVSECQEDHG